VHRPALAVLKRYGPSSQETYAYSLVDHLNWALVNGKTPETVTLDDLLRYMRSVGQADAVYGIAWRDSAKKPIGLSAAGNVASIVKAYYMTMAAEDSSAVQKELVGALEPSTVGEGLRSGKPFRSNPLAPRKSQRRPRFLPDEVVQALFDRGGVTTPRDVMILTWLHDGVR
jgi:hypothetical protein